MNGISTVCQYTKTELNGYKPGTTGCVGGVGGKVVLRVGRSVGIVVISVTFITVLHRLPWQQNAQDM